MKIETYDEKTFPITFEYDLKMQNAMKCIIGFYTSPF